MTRPHTIAEIPTPALPVDVPAMERNIRHTPGCFAAMHGAVPFACNGLYNTHNPPEAGR